MQRRRRLPTKRVIADIRAGMTDEGLMEKYDLDYHVLPKLFDKLVETNLLTQEDLRLRRDFFEGTVEIDLDGLACAEGGSAATGDMVWVTDGTGKKYLCPRGILNNGERPPRDNLSHLLDVGNAPMVLPDYERTS